jgi:acyl carrier protein
MIEKNTIEDRVLLVLENIVLQGYEITEDTTFPDMGLDSLDKIELCMDLEDEFGIEIPDDAMGYIDTFGELVEFISRQVKD